MIGKLVQSKAGRDKGEFFFVIEQIDEQFVLIVDGKIHKVEKPKKKKLKHLVIKSFISDEMCDKIKDRQNLSDKFVRGQIAKIINDSNQGGIVCQSKML